MHRTGLRDGGHSSWPLERCATRCTQDAARIAGLALELTDEDEISYRTAEMYEIRARWLLDSGSGQGRQELAQAIAIHLAFGSTERARELSKYFMPEGRSRHDETPEHGSDAWDGDLKAA